MTPPANQAHIYRALLHQGSMTYYRMHCYTVPIDTCHLLSPLVVNPTTPWQYDIAECRHTQCQLTPQIKPNCTDSYYTRTVWHLRMQTYPVLIDPPTPPQINPTCTEPYYTRTVWHWRMQMYQVPMKPHTYSQVYRALLYQDSMTLQNSDVPSPMHSSIPSYGIKCYRDVLQ